MEQRQQIDRRLTNRAAVVQGSIALAVLSLGLSVIVGSHVGNVTIVRERDPFAPMAYNAALGSVSCGTVVLQECSLYDSFQ